MIITVPATALAATAAAAAAALIVRKVSRPQAVRGERYDLPGGGSMTVADRAAVERDPHWSRALAGCRKDARYYGLVEDTLGGQGFDFRYFVLRDDAGRVRAIQPFLELNQDVVTGAGPTLKRWIGAARRAVPRLLTIRTLMIGCAAGEGHLDVSDDAGTPADRARRAAWVARSVGLAATRYASRAGCSMVVFKEFPSTYREAMGDLRGLGFTRVPSLPMVRLPLAFATFDEYLAKVLSKATRKGLRRKFRDAEASPEPITLEVLTDASAVADEVHALYKQVYDRSSLHFERLTPEFLRRLGTDMPDKARFFVWRRGGKAVAAAVILIDGDRLYDEYLGLDYAVALDLHLYFYTFRDIVRYALDHGLKWYYSTALNYDPKLHFKCELYPLDLYVRHVSPVANAVVRQVLPWLEPTRSDPTLGRFPNYADVWGDARPARAHPAADRAAPAPDEPDAAE
ncbi:MAG TPA: GNAT family N-acetyltransferase [Humisphaera sp.]